MSDDCCNSSDSCSTAVPPKFRRALWIALFVNASMFLVEFAAGLHAGSASLLADAVDFFGDAANYAITLIVLSMLPVWRSRAAMIKGLSMGTYGVYVLGQAGWNAFSSTVPQASTMGVIGLLALIANVSVALLLYAFREGDANMRSVWLCSRNDAIGNLAVMGAALGVFGTGSAWPDLLVAVVMGGLALSSAWTVVRHAKRELGEGDRHATHA